MDSFLFYVVLSITCNQILARPADGEDMSFEAKNRSKRDKYQNEFVFKLPKKISKGLIMTINGTINPKHPTLTMELPVDREDKGDCEIVYDFQNKLILSPHSPPRKFDFIGQGETTFALRIKARFLRDGHIFDVNFMENGEDGHPVVSCKVKNFEDFSLIKLKEGVKQITDLLFQFESYLIE